MFKPFPLLSAVALLALAPFAAPSAEAQATATAASKVKSTAESQAKAKKLYAMDCALCHGANGDGKTDLAKDMQLTMADWTDPKSLSGAVDQELFNVIRNGKGKMPSEDTSRAKDDDLWNVIIYIRKFAQQQPATTANQPPAAPTAVSATPQ